MSQFKVQSLNKIQDPTDRTTHGGIGHASACHSRESGNPEKYWIPDRVRNDKLNENFVVKPHHPVPLPSGRRGRACPVRDTGVRGGFTLIEVVVALAILGIVLTVIIELFAGGLRLARASKEYTQAVNYANAKLEEFASRETLEEGTTEGEFNETFHWRVTMDKINLLPVDKPWEVKPPVQLFKIRVDVLWKPGSKERSAGVETYRTMKVQDDEKKS